MYYKSLCDVALCDPEEDLHLQRSGLKYYIIYTKHGIYANCITFILRNMELSIENCMLEYLEEWRR
jgi:hypothetical protein